MDGASKFIKGDAMAAILITLINLVGGIIIGVVQQGMPFTEAGQHFSLLSGRRRPVRADPRAADLRRHRHPGHPLGLRGRPRQRHRRPDPRAAQGPARGRRRGHGVRARPGPAQDPVPGHRRHLLRHRLDAEEAAHAR
jgi:hypothetical protein